MAKRRVIVNIPPLFQTENPRNTVDFQGFLMVGAAGLEPATR